MEEKEEDEKEEEEEGRKKGVAVGTCSHFRLILFM